MSWVHKAPPPSEQHECKPPMRDRVLHVPRFVVGEESTTEHVETVPDGAHGDLWRCDTCRKLWRIGHACPSCDLLGEGRHGGMHVVGMMWRRATVWQRIRHHRRGRDVTVETLLETTRQWEQTKEQ